MFDWVGDAIDWIGDGISSLWDNTVGVVTSEAASLKRICSYFCFVLNVICNSNDIFGRIFLIIL